MVISCAGGESFPEGGIVPDGHRLQGRLVALARFSQRISDDLYYV